MSLPYVDEALRIDLSRIAFEQATHSETEKIAESIRECIRQAGVTPAAITTLFMTGGSSAIPAVRRACTATVAHAKVVEGDRFGSVGVGLTIHAGICANAQ